MNPTTHRKYAGLFGYMSSIGDHIAKIKSLKINNIVIYGDSYSAALVGQSGGIIENCDVRNATVNVAMDRDSTTTGSYYANAGGLVGCLNNLGQITDSIFNGNVTINEGAQDIQWVGGFVGQISSGATITNCTAADGKLDGSTAGTVPNTRGGFIGVINSPTGAGPVNITSCTSEVIVGTDTPDRKGRQFGGFIGYIYGGNNRNSGDFNITNCSSKGNVYGVSNMGGFIGYIQGATGNNLKISECSSQGIVKALHPLGNANAGGFIGNVESTIAVSKSYSTGDVLIDISTGESAPQKSGGFIGMINGQINVNDCYATGGVKGIGTGVPSQLGGFVGAFTNITSCASAIENCYATGQIIGTGNGFIGYTVKNSIFPNFFNNYFDSEKTGKSSSSNGSIPESQICGKTSEQMYDSATYVTWDFATIWEFVGEDTYPVLRT